MIAHFFQLHLAAGSEHAPLLLLFAWPRVLALVSKLGIFPEYPFVVEPSFFFIFDLALDSEKEKKMRTRDRRCCVLTGHSLIS